MTAVQVPFLCTAEFMALHRPVREHWSYIEVYPSYGSEWFLTARNTTTYTAKKQRKSPGTGVRLGVFVEDLSAALSERHTFVSSIRTAAGRMDESAQELPRQRTSSHHCGGATGPR